MSSVQTNSDFWIDPQYHVTHDGAVNESAQLLRRIAQDEVDIGISDNHRTTFFLMEDQLKYQ